MDHLYKLDQSKIIYLVVVQTLMPTSTPTLIEVAIVLLITHLSAAIVKIFIL